MIQVLIGVDLGLLVLVVLVIMMMDLIRYVRTVNILV